MMSNSLGLDILEHVGIQKTFKFWISVDRAFILNMICKPSDTFFTVMWTLTFKFDILYETLAFGHIYSFNTKRGKAFIFHMCIY